MVKLLQAAASFAQQAKKKEVKLGYPSDWCPYACKKDELKDGKMGFTVDIIKAALEPKGYKIDVSVNAYQRVIAQIKSGRITGSPAAYKEEIPDAIFPDTASFQGNMCFWGTKKNKEFKGDLGIYNKVGMIKGYDFSDKALLEYKKDNKNKKKIQVMGGNDAVSRLAKMVMTERVDVFHEDKTLVLWDQKLGRLPKELVSKGCETSTYAFFAIGKKWPNGTQIAKDLTDGIRNIRKSGKLKEIYSYYNVSDWSEDKFK